MQLPRSEQGSALILTLITVLVIVTLILSFTEGAVKESQGTTGLLDQTQSLFTAHSGIWAGSNWLSQGNDSSPAIDTVGEQVALNGNVVTGTWVVQTTADVDGNGTATSGELTTLDPDGFYSWSNNSVFTSAANRNGYFEVRIKRVSTTTFHIRARGVDDLVVRTVEGWTRRVQQGTFPFIRGTSSDKPLVMNANVFTDSYNSKNGARTADPWAGTFVTSYFDNTEHETFQVTRQMDGVTNMTDPVQGGNLFLRSTTGNPDDAKGDVASNGGITLNGSAHVFGDASPGPGADGLGGTPNQADDFSVTHNTGTYVNNSEAPLPTPLVMPLPVFTAPGSSYVGAGIPAHGSSPNYNGSAGNWNFAAAGSNVSLVINSVNVNSSGTLTITGAPGQVIDIYVTSTAEDAMKFNSNSHIRILPAGQTLGPIVRVFAKGGLTLNSGSSANRQGDPIQFQYYSSLNDTSKKAVELNSNGGSQAVWYAPGGKVVFNSSAEYFGAAVGGEVFMNSGVKFHYDESLGDLSTSTNPNYLYSPEAVVVIERR